MSKEINSEMIDEKKKNTKVKWTKVKNSFKSQQFKSGAYSSFLTVLVIAIVVVLNLVFAKLDLTTDLSSGSLFTLSKDTKKVVKNTDQDITIYYMVEDGNEIEYIYNVLKQYSKISDHISMKKIDPVVNPAFASKQGIDDEISSNDVIVVNNKTKSAKYVSAEEMYYSNQSYTSQETSYYLDVEGQVTSAIQNVISGIKTKMYVMTKHSEQALGSSIEDALDKMNVETEELELATLESVPDDCDILLLNGPTTDLTDAEKDVLLAYLKAGGSAMINVAYSTEKMPNFEEVLEYYGVNLTRGTIYEDTGRFATFLNYIIPTVNSEYTALSDLEGYIIFPDAAGLTAASGDALRSTVTITDIMDSSDASFVKVDPSSDNVSKEDGDVDGPFSVGLSISEKLDDEKETKLIVYSSASAFREDLTSTSQFENASVFSKSISSMIATDIEKVSIEAKDLSYSYVSLTPGTQLFWAAIIIIIIPVALLISGFAIWFVRRRK